MTKGTVLVVGSNATQIEIQGGGAGPTGQYLNETVVPAMALVEAGYAVVLATPNGRKPHIDEVSDSAQHFGGDEQAYQRARTFFARDASMNEVRTLRSVLEEGLENYAGVFVPGGQAPVVDLMQDGELGEILRHFHALKKPTAFLCHGPIASLAALPNAKQFRAALIAGDTARASELGKGWQYAGYKMTVFSASEEKPIEENILHGKLYFTMPDALQTAGGHVSTTPVDFEPNVIEDRELITGQNPRSDHPLAAKLVAALDRAKATV
ncbi:type 1 glutamine amidotransferase domain-containing protein [Rhizobium changzhiense]|uniref:type 1 glutamine amidotransferase domain-containing protein n=1 Tax=Rhizobium changzhiense TaxID=2692317 RepID=UPI001F0B98C3|nr:type 1 glutamine amidotransferase domain-containing protein [Rhizobium changzhiense]MCH4546004.1 type 1 glutamine amidotransferase domain-containing protein [Rhizobium changzhiense]